MNKPCMLALIFGLTLLGSFHAHAAFMSKFFDPQPSIDRCWAQSNEFRRFDAAAPIRIASDQTVACLKRLAIKELGVIFAREAFERERQRLDAAERDYLKLTRAIFALADECRTGCEDVTGLDRTRWAEVLQRLILDVVFVRNQFTSVDSLEAPELAFAAHFAPFSDRNEEADAMSDLCVALADARAETGSIRLGSQGLSATVRCLHEPILDRYGDWATSAEAGETMEKLLDTLSESYVGLLDDIHMSNRFCGGSCGLIAEMEGRFALDWLFGETARDVVWMRNRIERKK